MADSFTNNRNLVLPLVGGDSGTWGGILNSGVMSQLDAILGATEAVSITSSDVTLSQSQWNNAAIRVSGTLTGNHSLVLPFNPNSSSVAVGGLFVIDNQTTGAFTVTVLTAASGSTGVVVPQGLRTWLFSDTTNVWYADDAKVQLIQHSGNPNGSVAGVQGSVNNPPSVLWDYTNAILYICTVTGTISTAVWTNISLSGSALPTPQGYLTPVSNTAIITTDSIGAMVVYYTPFKGSWAAIHNGSVILPYQFSQMQLTLSSSQSANSIYDVFLVYNGGTPVIGTGPSWSAAGGSITTGSCARGTGAGSTAISRASPSGLWVNTVSMSLIWNTGSGNNTITVGAGQGILLGSIWIDGTDGQTTIHLSYGKSRKRGISNAYNRVPVYLKGGDSAASWTPKTFQAANGDTTNSVAVFQALAEDSYVLRYLQSIQTGTDAGSSLFIANIQCGIGFNSTNTFTGTQGKNSQNMSNQGALIPLLTNDAVAEYVAPPSLGINLITAVENAAVAGFQPLFFGTELSMLLSAQWMA